MEIRQNLAWVLVLLIISSSTIAIIWICSINEEEGPCGFRRYHVIGRPEKCCGRLYEINVDDFHVIDQNTLVVTVDGMSRTLIAKEFHIISLKPCNNQITTQNHGKYPQY